MLNHIQILNYAIVDSLDVDLGPNMTVLTGETGAGKSILVDALGLVLGDRADADAVREGALRAEVSAAFTVTALPMVRTYLADHALLEDDVDPAKDTHSEVDAECLIRRVVGKDGRSRAFVNGRAVPLQTLRELGALLVDIHGQHAHQSLLVRDAQREILDDYADNVGLQREVATCYESLRQLSTEYQRIHQATADRENRLEYLRFQIRELDDMAVKEGELDALEEERRWLAHATRLQDGGRSALVRLEGEGVPNVLGLLFRVRNDLRPLQGIDARLASVAELVEGAVIQAEEAAVGLRHYLETLDLDPHRMDFVEERLIAIKELARKFRIEPAALAELAERLRHEIAELEQSELRTEALASSVAAARRTYREVATRLHAARTRMGAELAERVTKNLHALGMPGGHFEVACTFLADQEGESGMDRVEFLVSTNPGSPMRPLAKVVSGGELSRISLALQVLVATNLRVPTLVFDEVDVGVGGRVAGIVGRLLHKLGERCQVLCVTHLPQVAAEGHHHLLVTKSTESGATRVAIRALAAEERVQEIARMLGGGGTNRPNPRPCRGNDYHGAADLRREGGMPFLKTKIAIAVLCVLLLPMGLAAAPSEEREVLHTSATPHLGATTALEACWDPEALRATPHESAVRYLSAPDHTPPERVAPETVAAPVGEEAALSVRSIVPRNGEKLVALTFDLCERASEITGYDGALVDLLRAEQVRATFFCGW